MKNIIDQDEIMWQEINGNPGSFSRWIITEELWNNVDIQQVRIEPGGMISMHSHELETEAHYILSGIGIASFENEEKKVGPGNIILAYPHIRHGLKNPGPEPLLLLCVFNPPLK